MQKLYRKNLYFYESLPPSPPKKESSQLNYNIQLILLSTGLKETVDMVKAAGGTCYGYVCDLCDSEDVYKKAAIVSKEVGKVSEYVYIHLYAYRCLRIQTRVYNARNNIHARAFRKPGHVRAVTCKRARARGSFIDTSLRL